VHVSAAGKALKEVGWPPVLTPLAASASMNLPAKCNNTDGHWCNNTNACWQPRFLSGHLHIVALGHRERAMAMPWLSAPKHERGKRDIASKLHPKRERAAWA
jgi:hypothetical protein